LPDQPPRQDPVLGLRDEQLEQGPRHALLSSDAVVDPSSAAVDDQGVSPALLDTLRQLRRAHRIGDTVVILDLDLVLTRGQHELDAGAAQWAVAQRRGARRNALSVDGDDVDVVGHHEDGRLGRGQRGLADSRVCAAGGRQEGDGRGGGEASEAGSHRPCTIPRGLLYAGAMKKILAQYPLRRLGRPDDVIPMVLPASPLSSWTTGQVIPIDGGYAMV